MFCALGVFGIGFQGQVTHIAQNVNREYIDKESKMIRYTKGLTTTCPFCHQKVGLKGKLIKSPRFGHNEPRLDIRTVVMSPKCKHYHAYGQNIKSGVIDHVFSEGR
jgi:hypothetical protein